MHPDAARHLAAWFADAAIGVVCGKLVLLDRQTGRNVDGMYWKYETFLKKCESRLGAWASPQSRPLADRDELDARYDAEAERFDGVEDVPLPGFWGGYRLTPRAVELWQNRPNRLHEPFPTWPRPVLPQRPRAPRPHRPPRRACRTWAASSTLSRYSSNSARNRPTGSACRPVPSSRWATC